MTAAVAPPASTPSLQARLLRLATRWLLRPTVSGPLPVARRRARLEWLARLTGLPARGTEISAGKLNGVDTEWVRHVSAARSGVILYLHGGAYTIGSPRVYRDLTSRLSRITGMRVAVIDYRLAPEHPFPAAIEDATQAYQALLRAGLTAEQIMFAGDSAGGGLAVATALMAREAGLPQPAGIICYSPWIDLSLAGESMRTQKFAEEMLSPEALALAARDYLGPTDVRNPYASPVFADLAGLAPIFIQVGSDEILFDDAARLAKQATVARVSVEIQIWRGMWHVWQGYAGKLPEADRALVQTARFVDKWLGPIAQPAAEVQPA